MVSCSNDAKEAQNPRNFLTIVTSISFYRMFLVNEVVYVSIICLKSTIITVCYINLRKIWS